MRIELLEARCLLAASLQHVVWLDVNEDGLQDGAEPPVAGAVVELFQTVNGIARDGDDLSLGTQITDSIGRCRFEGLSAGRYYLEFRTPVGLTFTTPDAGADDAADSDVDPASGLSGVFELAAGESNTTFDAGLIGTPPRFGFALRAGGADKDGGRAIATDADGNAYVTGVFAGSADFDAGPGTLQLASSGASDVFVAKYTPAGALVWARSMGGAAGSGEGLGLAVSAGGVYMTGRFRGTVDFDPGPNAVELTSVGDDDVFIAKLNSNGQFVWARSIGGGESDVGYGITVDANENVYVTGSYRSEADFDPGKGVCKETSKGGSDVFVVKLDSLGELVWARSMGGPGDDEGRGVVVATGGDVFTVGQFTLTGDFDPGAATANLSSAGDRDVFVSKLGRSGSFVWARSMGGAERDEAAGAAIDANGNLYVAGGFAGTADFDPGPGLWRLSSAGAEDIFVAKLDRDGELAWARAMGGGGDDQATAIAVSSSGYVYSTGRFEGSVDFDPATDAAAGGGAEEGQGELELTVGVAKLDSAVVGSTFVSVLDAQGRYAFAGGLGGGAQTARSIALGRSDDVFTTGYFEGLAEFDPGEQYFPLASAGGADLFVSKLTANRAPTVIAPPGWIGYEDAVLPISGIGILDEDSATADIEVTISAGVGSLSVLLNVPGGLGVFDVIGNGSGAVILRGPPGEINATLSDPVGLTYLGGRDLHGTDAITISVNDWGNGGPGPAKTTSRPAAVDVGAVNDQPRADPQIVETSEQLTGVEQAITLTGDDGDPEVEQKLTFVITTLPQAGQLSQTRNGPAIKQSQLPFALSGDRVFFKIIGRPVATLLQEFQFIVIDDGGTAYGGKDTSEPATVTINILNLAPPSWQNPVNHVDVNGDGRVSPVDALVLINCLNSGEFKLLSAPMPDFGPPPWLDPNGDESLTPADVLLVINALNALSSAQGEGEGASRQPAGLPPQRTASLQSADPAPTSTQALGLGAAAFTTRRDSIADSSAGKRVQAFGRGEPARDETARPWRTAVRSMQPPVQSARPATDAMLVDDSPARLPDLGDVLGDIVADIDEALRQDEDRAN